MFKLKRNEKINLIVVVLFILSALASKGQIQLHDGMLTKTTKMTHNNTFIVVYTDIKIKPENCLFPVKDDNGKIPLWMDFKLNSIEKLNQITQEIFTFDQIKYLYSYHCYVNCVVSSSGKIISASIEFMDGDPDVQLKQLVELSKQVKEKLSFKFEFDRKIVEEGLYPIDFPAFKGLFKVRMK